MELVWAIFILVIMLIFVIYGPDLLGSKADQVIELYRKSNSWVAVANPLFASGLLSVGLIPGLAFGLRNGGLAYFKHYVLRILLWRNDYAPWNYIRFLNYAAERVFLRKVGGGYIFTHRLLMEHFATLQPTDQAGQAKTA